NWENLMTTPNVPTLYEWVGGMEVLNRLTTRFYEHVQSDPLLAPIFANMSADHPGHVAAFLAEVLGGPTTYSEQHGGHPHMIQRHLNRHLTQEQRRRWVSLLLETADELRMPDDPEFRSALVGYLEWGSRLAVINSQSGATVNPDAPMPKWGWGEVKGPYRGWESGVQSYEKLVHLRERLDRRIRRTGAGSIESFLRRIEFMHDQQRLATFFFEGHRGDGTVVTFLISPNEARVRCHFDVSA